MSNHAELKKRERPQSVKSILIVDDNPDIALTFKKGLEAENNKKSYNDNILFDRASAKCKSTELGSDIIQVISGIVTKMVTIDSILTSTFYVFLRKLIYINRAFH